MSGAVDPAGVPSRPYGALHRALIERRFALTFEVSSPRGAGTKTLRSKARILRGLVDAVNLTDGQGGVARMAPWAGCVVMLQEGLEPVMQLQSRDRNRLALQADLLGAGAVGVPNVTLTTGDDPRFGDEPDAHVVGDLDSVALIGLAKEMRDAKRLHSGYEMAVPPRWLIGCVEDPYAADQTAAVERFARKVEAGAQYVQTQYVFDVEAFGRWLQQVRDHGLDERCAILAGAGPIMSSRALHYLTHDFADIHVPESVVRRLEGLSEERMQDEGLAIAAETMQALRELPGVAGIHVLANGWEERLPELLRHAGIERPGGREAVAIERPSKA